MTQNWQKAKQRIKAFQLYVNNLGLPQSAQSKKAICFMITREEINQLLTQGGQQLAGLRIYLGADTESGYMIPTVHVLACEKDENGEFHDYKLSKQFPQPGTQEYSALPRIAEGLPCPTWCGNNNFLNS